MSHEVESLMYVRETPWHGLGVKVDNAPTSAEAIKLAGLDWKVESKPIFTDSGSEIPNYKATTRDTDGAVFGIVSDRYKVVQNQEAFDFTDSLIGEGCKYETAGSLLGGKRVFLLAKMPETKILEDNIEPYICFTNSHTGTGAIQACLTPIRVVCQNTLNLALNGANRKWSTKHVGDMQSKLNEARHTLQLANNYMSELNTTADMLAHTKVTDDEVIKILDDLFPVETTDSDRKKRNIEEMKENFIICTLAPDILKFKNTGWGVVNAASDFMSHIAPKRRTDTYKERNFGRILDGHIVLDTFFERIMKERVLKSI